MLQRANLLALQDFTNVIQWCKFYENTPYFIDFLMDIVL